MNNCTLSGRLHRNAIARGTDPKVLSFVLETRQQLQDGDRKERIAFVPCVIFNPALEIERTLTETGKGLSIELEGRLTSSSYDVKGETRFNCEVIVRPWTLTIQPGFANAD